MQCRLFRSRSSVSRLAFTMLELLVVIAIMTILAAMILVGAKAILGNAERKKTETIIQTVKVGIELAIANKGSAISPTEHPFAGSRAPRFPFTRTRKSFSGPVSTTGTALRGVPTPEYLGADQTKLLMTDDRYADRRVVLLYGARREDIGVLQALRKVVTSYRLLPMPPKSTPPPPRVIDPTTGSPASSYSNTNFPDTMIPSISTPPKPTDQENDPNFGKLADSKPALDYLFGNSSAQSELASLKAIFNADPTLPEDKNDFRTPIEKRGPIGGVDEPLVYTNSDTGKGSQFSKAEPHWKPGYIPVSTGATKTLEPPTSNNWVRYRLAGLAVYDAWGNELMTVTGANNSYRVISAGQDGALAVDPDKNYTIETDITVDTVTSTLLFDSKDKDGAKDNLQ
jgi:prepilin-type N-terminal cleavage/methylation domain-containing protein